MTVPMGKLRTIVKKNGRFGDYEILGSWVCSSDLKRAWFLQMDGLDSGSFAVVDGEIRFAELNLLAGPDGETIAPIGEKAQMRPSAEKAVFDAIAKWETEERERPVEF